MHKNRMLGCVLVLLSLSGLAGCAAAAVGGATAGVIGGIAYTDRGAKGEVQGNVQAVNERAREALKEMGVNITDTSSKESGRQQSLVGRGDGKDITVNMTSSGENTTSVEVIAQEGAVKWNKDYARDILNRIVDQG